MPNLTPLEKELLEALRGSDDALSEKFCHASDTGIEWHLTGDTQMKCERCNTTLVELPDYCAECGKNLCDECMDEGCCGCVPAESGSEDDWNVFVKRSQARAERSQQTKE